MDDTEQTKNPTALVGTNTPMREVEGKVAFITGGSSGIGLGIARAFVDAGMKIVITYQTEKHLHAAITMLQHAGPNVHSIKLDVTDRRGMEHAAAETKRLFGKIHVLVNNAGVFGFVPLRSTTYDDWDWIINVNVNGVFNGIHTFIPHIEEHGEGGHILTIASLVGLVAGGRTGGYTASKFAVVGMMESLRAELSGTNVGASVCCPGLVRTQFMQSTRDCLIFCVLSHTLPDRAGSEYGEEQHRRVFEGAAGSAASRT